MRKCNPQLIWKEEQRRLRELFSNSRVRSKGQKIVDRLKQFAKEIDDEYGDQDDRSE